DRSARLAIRPSSGPTGRAWRPGQRNRLLSTSCQISSSMCDVRWLMQRRAATISALHVTPVVSPLWPYDGSPRSLVTRKRYAAFGLDTSTCCHHSLRLAEIAPVDILQPKHGEAGRRSHQHLPREIRRRQLCVEWPHRVGLLRGRESRPHRLETLEQLRSRALDQGEQRGDTPDHDEAIPQATASQEGLRDRGRRLFPETPHAIQIGRGTADTLTGFDPAVSDFAAMRDHTKQHHEACSRLRGFEGPPHETRERFVVRHIVIRWKDRDRTLGGHRAYAEQPVEDRRCRSAIVRLDHE